MMLPRDDNAIRDGSAAPSDADARPDDVSAPSSTRSHGRDSERMGTWRIAVDTGGTFTDLVAIDPAGVLHRAKVLSTSALRGFATALDDHHLRLDAPWLPLPDDFLCGMRFRALVGREAGDSASAAVTDDALAVVRHEGDSSIVRLNRPLAHGMQRESASSSVRLSCELLSDEEAPILAARLVTRTPRTAPLPAGLQLRLATTRGTNALLERRGARVAFFVTRGFRDLLVIGNQQRPDLFALNIIRPRPLYDRVIEVSERIDSQGRVIEPLDVDALADEIARARQDGISVAAIALVNAYVNPEHEQVLGRVLLGRGFEFAAASAELAPRIRLLPRAQTAVVDAYLTPVLHSYVRNIERSVSGSMTSADALRVPSPEPPLNDAATELRAKPVLHLMTSAGGLVSARAFRPKDSLLSGPAGGVAGAAAAGRRSGFDRIIGFDMGGTSTDVSRYDGAFEYQFEHAVGDAHLFAPALAIETVAAGGGSIAWFDGHRLRVGPHSAGAAPGPACYGAGGPLTLTDVNLLIGHLNPQRFALPLDVHAAFDALADLMLAVEDKRRFGDLSDDATAEQPRAGEQPQQHPDTPHALAGRNHAQRRRALLDDRGFPARARTMLHGLLDIANERMAEAIRRISVRRGDDPTRYTLVAFGGAGGQHACAVAERLGIQTVIVPQDAGLLSAVGLQHAALERFAEQQVLRLLHELLEHPTPDGGLNEILARLEALARGAVRRELHNMMSTAGDSHTIQRSSEDLNIGETIAVRRRIASLRLLGQETTIDCDFIDPQDLPRLFAEAYVRLYGHAPSDRITPEVESVRVVASTQESSAHAADDPAAQVVPRVETTEERLVPGLNLLHRIRRPLPAYERAQLRVASAIASGAEQGSTSTARVAGPALITEAHALTVIANGWTASLDAAGAVVLRHHAPAEVSEHWTHPEAVNGREKTPGETASSDRMPSDAAREAIDLELFTNRFRTIAEQTGDVLRRTALSTNVKERLDFSCAVLDADGQLVVNAPHIPVHLGAMGVCVRRVMEHLHTVRPGDVLVTNHPGFGGSHLPDVTIITPVFLIMSDTAEMGEASASQRLLGFIASRAHHAEIGGVTPGSMPPHASQLIEEGVVLSPRRIVEAGEPQWDALRSLLKSAPHPTRLIEENIADMQAAVAANHQGAIALRALALEHGPDVVRHYMDRLRQQSADRVREALRARPDATLIAEEPLDDGSPIVVRIEIRGDEATIDFTGTAPTHPGNLNCTDAVVRSAVMYVLRLLIAQPLPLNEGLLIPVRLIIPRGTLLNPVFDLDDPANCPAVVGGNVETSQRVVDTLIRALGLAACSQGTMNNVVFGNRNFGYYETICGGAGAGPDFDGADAVHTHMTNTRITDVEVIEHRYPVRIDQFEIRRDSGGRGRHRGGNGVRRAFTFLQGVELSVLAQHRHIQPYGVEGGGLGAAGRQFLVRHARGPRDATPAATELAGVDHARLSAGDRFVIETPGGGGWGSP